MRKLLCLIFAALLCAAALAGCKTTGETETGRTPTENGTTTPDAPASPTVLTPTPTPSADTPDPTGTPALPTTEDGTATPTGEEDQPLDLKALLENLVAEHPNATAEELCTELMKNPYFLLFRGQNTTFYYPGLNWDYKPEGVLRSYGMIENSKESAVIVIEPDENADPEALARGLAENADPNWRYLDEERAPDLVFSEVIGGKVFFALYYSGMKPITVYADKARDYIGMFHDYCAEHPDARCEEMAEYFVEYQKLAVMRVESVEEGILRGFGVWDEERGWYKDVEITGFSEGVRFEPNMEPNTFMGYIFTVKDGVNVEEFAKMLEENANLAYNVCTSVNTVATEIDGNRVLFMMFDERKTD